MTDWIEGFCSDGKVKGFGGEGRGKNWMGVYGCT